MNDTIKILFDNMFNPTTYTADFNFVPMQPNPLCALYANFANSLAALLDSDEITVETTKSDNGTYIHTYQWTPQASKPDVTQAIGALEEALNSWWKISSIDTWYTDGGERADLDMEQEIWFDELEEAFKAVKKTIGEQWWQI